MLLVDKKILVMMVLVMLYAYAVRQEQKNCDKSLPVNLKAPLCKFGVPAAMPKSSTSKFGVPAIPKSPPNAVVFDQVIRPNQSPPDNHPKAALPRQGYNQLEKTAIKKDVATKAKIPSAKTTPAKPTPQPKPRPATLPATSRRQKPLLPMPAKSPMPAPPGTASPCQQTLMPEQSIKYIVKETRQTMEHCS